MLFDLKLDFQCLKASKLKYSEMNHSFPNCNN